MTRTKIFVIAVAAVMSACSKDSPTGPPVCTSNCNPPPPVTETFTPTINNPSNGAVVSLGMVMLSASAVSNVIGAITDDSKYSWTLNGTPIGSGKTLPVSVTNPGSDTVCVSVTGRDSTFKSCSVFVAQQTSISLRAVVANIDKSLSTTPSGLNQVTLMTKTDTASVALGSDGTVTITNPKLVPQTSSDTTRLVFDAFSKNQRTYHPMIAYLSRSDVAQGVTLVLVPFSETIPSGNYANAVVPIDLNKAYIAGADNISFYDRFNDNGKWFYVVGSQTTLPQPVAAGTSGAVLLTSQNMADVMSALNTLNQFLGGSYFRSANAGEVTSNFGVTVTSNNDPIVPGGAAANGGQIANSTLSDYTGGSVTYTNPSVITAGNNNGGATRHEFIHVLGFGHGCGWASLQNQFCDSFHIDYTGFTLGNPSREDVAYILLMYRVRELERQYNTRFSLAESHQGERVFMLGLQEEVFYKGVRH